MVGFLAGVIVGFVAGIFVYRNNAKVIAKIADKVDVLHDKAKEDIQNKIDEIKEK